MVRNRSFRSSPAIPELNSPDRFNADSTLSSFFSGLKQSVLLPEVQKFQRLGRIISLWGVAQNVSRLALQNSADFFQCREADCLGVTIFQYRDIRRRDVHSLRKVLNRHTPLGQQHRQIYRNHLDDLR